MEGTPLLDPYSKMLEESSLSWRDESGGGGRERWYVCFGPMVEERDSLWIVVLHLGVNVIYFFLLLFHQSFFFHFRQDWCFHPVGFFDLEQNYKQLQFCQNWSVCCSDEAKTISSYIYRLYFAEDLQALPSDILLLLNRTLSLNCMNGADGATRRITRGHSDLTQGSFNVHHYSNQADVIHAEKPLLCS